MKPSKKTVKRSSAKPSTKKAASRSKTVPIADLEVDSISELICGNAPFAVFCLDRDFKLQYANPRFFEFITENYQTSVSCGECVLDLLPKSRRALWQSRLEEVFEGQYLRVEEVMESEYGPRYFDVAYQPILHPGGQRFIIIYFEEISVRRRREIKQQEDEASARQMLAARETLLSVISHDLRSPIFQLNALLYNIRISSGQRDENRLQMHAEDLEERIAHLTHTLDNLLSWSNLNRRNIAPQVSTFKVKEVCEHAVGLFKPNAERKRVLLRTRCGGSVHTLRSDPELVAFIIRNLVNNAVKFSSEGGTVMVTVQLDAVGMHLEVKDSGTGMSRDKVAALRSTHSLESAAGTWGERGTGLGLSLTYEFVQRLQGELEIRSRKGHGTVVSVELPNYS